MLDGLKRAWEDRKAARYLRELLHQQVRQTQTLDQLAASLNGIGKILASNSHVPWIDHLQRRPDDQVMATSDTGGGPPGDADTFFADLEAIQDDYRERFDREITAEEALHVYEDHQAAREGTVEP